MDSGGSNVQPTSAIEALVNFHKSWKLSAKVPILNQFRSNSCYALRIQHFPTTLLSAFPTISTWTCSQIRATVNHHPPFSSAKSQFWINLAKSILLSNWVSNISQLVLFSYQSYNQPLPSYQSIDLIMLLSTYSLPAQRCPRSSHRQDNNRQIITE